MITVDQHIANNHVQRPGRALCWVARIISLVATANWLLILITILGCDLVSGCVTISWETGFLVFLVTVSVLSVILAWQREAIGGLIMLLWRLAFSVIAYVTSSPYQLFSILASGFPFFLAGCLFLAGNWRAHSSRNLPHPAIKST